MRSDFEKIRPGKFYKYDPRQNDAAMAGPGRIKGVQSSHRKKERKRTERAKGSGFFGFFFTAPSKTFSHLLKIISSTWLSIVWRSWYILLWESIIEFFDFAVYIYICDIPYMKFRQLRCRNCMPHQETMGCKLCAYDTWKCLQDLYAIKYYAVQYCKWTIASGFFFGSYSCTVPWAGQNSRTCTMHEVL